MTKKRLVYIVSEIDKSLHFEWITPYLKTHFELSFILIGKPDSALERFLKSENVHISVLAYSGKSDLVKVWLQALGILLRHRPHIVHTHLWIANLVGLTASRVAGVRKRIYTRHHASIHHKKHKTGIKWDRLNNKLATQIIAISKNVLEILTVLDRADKKKLRLLHHGFSFSYFEKVDSERINTLYRKHSITPSSCPVVGVISRLTEWKGVQYIIPAFEKLRFYYPDAQLVLANAHGDYEKEIDRLLSGLPPTSFTKIRFENDLAALYGLFDIFVHVPVDQDSEAFGQTYVESLLSGVPAIFTLSGIAREFIVDNQNAVVVDFRNADQIFAAMLKILTDPKFRDGLSENGKKSVAGFSIEKYLTALKELYLEA